MAQELISTAAEASSPDLRDDSVLREYQLDYDEKVRYGQQHGKWSTLAQLLWPCHWPCCPGIVAWAYCFLPKNEEDQARAQHLLVTVDGVKYVVDKHKAGLRFSFADEAAQSQLVPYDKISDVSVIEPAGAENLDLYEICPCYTIPRTLNTVIVSQTGNGYPIVVEGVADAQKFKHDVLVMRRGGPLPDTYAGLDLIDAAVPPAERIRGRDGGGDGEVAQLLRQQIGLLESIDASLKVVARQSTPALSHAQLADVLAEAPAGVEKMER